MSNFATLINEFLEATWQNDPPMATRSGIHRYDQLLPNPDPDAQQGWAHKLADFARRFEASDPATLTRDEQLDRRWALAIIDRELLDEELSPGSRNPRSYLEGLGSGLHNLLIGEFAPIEERYGSLLARLKAIPDYLTTAQRNLKPTSIPPIWIEYAQLTGRSTRQFLTDAVPKAATQTPRLEKELVHASQVAAQAILDYEAAVRGMGDKAQGDYAIGRERFDRLLKRFHMLDMDADQLYDFGREWIDRYEREMTEVAKQIDPNRTWVDVLETVKDNHPTAEGLRQAYEDETLLARQHCLDLDLITFPEGESCDLEWMPAFLWNTYPIALPWTSPAFEPGLYSKWYITPANPDWSPERQRNHLRDHSWAWIRGIAQHEIYPGHHLHKVIAKQRATPLRLQFWSPIFTEGWGLYTEELWYETGPMAAPHLRLMQLRNGLWRAVRIVIDTGLHTRGMTTQEGVRWLHERARLEIPWSETETRLYTTIPTYISSYRVGLSMVMDLRERYKAKLGSAFTLKKFHDTLMGYSVLPMSMVMEEMLGT